MRPILFFLALAASASAQTNFFITTNWITAASHFREVQGRLYNINKSILWHDFDDCECVTVLTNGVLVEEVSYKRSYEAIHPTGTGIGDQSPPVPQSRRLIFEERVAGRRFVLTNY